MMRQIAVAATLAIFSMPAAATDLARFAWGDYNSVAFPDSRTALWSEMRGPGDVIVSRLPADVAQGADLIGTISWHDPVGGRVKPMLADKFAAIGPGDVIISGPLDGMGAIAFR